MTSLPDEIEVNVNKTDIAKGSRRAASVCPIALAVTRKYGVPALVAPRYVLLDGLRQGYYLLPEEVRQWVTNYDKGFPVQPISFIAKNAPLAETFQYD